MLESDPELDIDLNPESNSDSDLVFQYSSLSSSSSLPRLQPWRRQSSTSLTWSLPWPPSLSQQATYAPAPSS